MRLFLLLLFLLPSVALAQGLDDCSGVQYEVIDDATSGDNTLVAAVTGKKIRVFSYVLWSGGSVNARFESGAGGTALTGQMTTTTTESMAVNCAPYGCFETAAGALLNLELSAAVSVDGHLTYALCN